MDKDWVKMHRKIKKVVDKEKKCVDIYNISEKLNEDVHNVRPHFEIMKMDGYGNFKRAGQL